MITELNWQPLAERHRIARLVMFYKTHYQLVAITMPLELKLLLMPTRTENALAYVIPSSSCNYHMYSFYPRTVREWSYLPQDVVQLGTPEAFRSALQSVSTGPEHFTATCSEWASRPIPEELEVHLLLP